MDFHSEPPPSTKGRGTRQEEGCPKACGTPPPPKLHNRALQTQHNVLPPPPPPSLPPHHCTSRAPNPPMQTSTPSQQGVRRQLLPEGMTWWGLGLSLPLAPRAAVRYLAAGRFPLPGWADRPGRLAAGDRLCRPLPQHRACLCGCKERFYAAEARRAPRDGGAGAVWPERGICRFSPRYAEPFSEPPAGRSLPYCGEASHLPAVFGLGLPPSGPHCGRRAGTRTDRCWTSNAAPRSLIYVLPNKTE